MLLCSSASLPIVYSAFYTSIFRNELCERERLLMHLFCSSSIICHKSGLGGIEECTKKYIENVPYGQTMSSPHSSLKYVEEEEKK